MGAGKSLEIAMQELTDVQKVKAEIIARLVAAHMERGSVSTSRENLSTPTINLIAGAAAVADEIINQL